MESAMLRQRLHTPPAAKLAAQDVQVPNTKGVRGSSKSTMAIDDIIKYGEFCQLTMDAVDLNEWSRYRGQIKYPDPADLLDDSPPDDHSKAARLDDSPRLGHLSNVSAFQWLPKVCPPHEKAGYKAKAYLYASEDTQVAKAIVKKGKPIVSGNGICIGYIAYSAAAKDIVVAWRGTGRIYEWLQDAEVDQFKYEAHAPPPFSPGKRAPQPVPNSKKDILPPPVAKNLLGVLAGVAASVYGGLPALLIFSVGSLFFGLADGEELFAVLFTALYAAFASLPFYRKILPKLPGGLDLLNWFESPNLNIPLLSSLGLPPAGNFAVLYALGIGLLSLVLNSVAVTTAPHFPLTLFAGNYWSVNALLVSLSSLLWLSVTSGGAAYAAAGEGPFVHKGFWDFYNNLGEESADQPKGKEAERSLTQDKEPEVSSREVLLKNLTELIKQHEEKYPSDRNLTITLTGHSLGGAMAALSAFDVVESDYNVYPDGSRVNVRAVTFEAPRVGNPAFVQRFADHKAHLKFVRVANEPDLVPDVPKAFFLQNIYFVICTLLNWQWGRTAIKWVETIEYITHLPSAYEHAKTEPGDKYLFELDSTKVEYLKRMGSAFDLSGNLARLGTYHNLELNLYLLSFDEAANVYTRDVALVNKSGDNLDPRIGIAPDWLETLSPDVVKASGVRPERAAMIEPYNFVDKRAKKAFEESREIGTWNSDKNPSLVKLTRTMPDIDAGETTAAARKRGDAL